MSERPALADALSAEITGFEALNRVLEEEYAALVGADVDHLLSLSDDKKHLVMRTDGEERLDQLWDVLLGKLIKRGITANSLERGDKKPAGGKQFTQEVALQQGIPQDKAKELVKKIKDTKLKVQPAIQGDLIRVTAKDRDDLQAIILLCRENADAMHLDMQNTNFRE